MINDYFALIHNHVAALRNEKETSAFTFYTKY